MIPIVPCDFLSGSLELVCYACTLVAAFLSYLFMIR